MAAWVFLLMGVVAMFGWLSFKKKNIEIVGQTFKNVVVPLDYKAYKDCTFEDVQFSYEGHTVITILNGKFIGHIRFDSNNLSIKSAIAFTVLLNNMSTPKM